MVAQSSGLWNKVLENIKNSSNEDTRGKKTVLLISNSPNLQKDLISKLRAISKTENAILFNEKESDKDDVDIFDGFGLGYSYVEVRLGNLGAETQLIEPVLVDIYTLTYDLKNGVDSAFDIFLNRFKGYSNLSVIDVLDVECCLDEGNGLALASVVESKARTCRQLKAGLDNESSNERVTTRFIRSKSQYNEIYSRMSSHKHSQIYGEKVIGECDTPLGVDYTLIVAGTDTLSDVSNISISRLEVDRFQQLLRTLVLKMGGSLHGILSLAQDDTKTRALVGLIRDEILDVQVKAEPKVDDWTDLVVPRGWDSWGKIKVLNDNFEIEKWNEVFDVIVSPSIDESNLSLNKVEQLHVENGGEENKTGADDQIAKYQTFLGEKYKLQLEKELQQSSVTPSKQDISVIKEVMENSIIVAEEPDVSVASFQETHSVLQDFRLQFLENDADILAGLQSTPGVARTTDTVPLGSNPAKFKDFFSDLLARGD